MYGFKARMVELIAENLRTGGEYCAEMPADPPQGVVDTWWAAHAAGRLVGGRVQITNECRPSAVGQSMVILVRLQRSSGAGAARTRT